MKPKGDPIKWNNYQMESFFLQTLSCIFFSIKITSSYPKTLDGKEGVINQRRLAVQTRKVNQKQRMVDKHKALALLYRRQRDREVIFLNQMLDQNQDLAEVYIPDPQIRKTFKRG